MVYFPLILFFTSLASIIFMIGKKLAVLENQQMQNQEGTVFEIPYLKEVKHVTIKGIKKHGYTLLVSTVRFYVRGINLLNNKYNEIKNKIKARNKENNINNEKKEISKFLKIIGDYKYKIREIKHRITKEEENL